MKATSATSRTTTQGRRYRAAMGWTWATKRGRRCWRKEGRSCGHRIITKPRKAAPASAWPTTTTITRWRSRLATGSPVRSSPSAPRPSWPSTISTRGWRERWTSGVVFVGCLWFCCCCYTAAEKQQFGARSWRFSEGCLHTVNPMIIIFLLFF